MMKFNKIEFMVGCFMLAGILAGVLLSLKVAGLTFDDGRDSYTLFARFDNIGGLKVRSPIKIGGVVVGRVSDIQIDTKTLAPVVEMQIQERYNSLADTTTASILTSGLLGEQYIGLTPGFSDEDMGTTVLKSGDRIGDTKSAIVLEDLIGKFLYSQSNK
jgi:phospholipid/cholesterol/gamma-HCH transport system substrate-binding protein